MKITVITVCLNSARTIEQTIRSVIGQGYDELEYIIIDGQSTDGTMEIINKYKDKISLIISETDEGLYDAMNNGISKATGDIIGILNSDDWYEQGALQSVADAFVDSGVEIVHGQANRYDEDRFVMHQKGGNIETLWYTMEMRHPTVFVRRNVYEKYGVFDTCYRVSADYELMLRFYTKGVHFKYLDKVITNFRLGGVSSQMTEQIANDIFQICMDYIKFAPEEDRLIILEKIKRAYQANMFLAKGIMRPDDLYNRIVECCKKENEIMPVMIFGAGKWGMQICQILRNNNLLPKGFVDNNSESWNHWQCDIKVCSPAELQSFKGVVLIMVKEHSQEILEQLRELNNSDLKCVCWEELTGV